MKTIGRPSAEHFRSMDVGYNWDSHSGALGATAGGEQDQETFGITIAMASTGRRNQEFG